VISSRVRAAALLGASALALAAWPVSQASAVEITASQITSPADPSYFLSEGALENGGPEITVAGTTSGAGNVDIRCYYGTSFRELATNVTVTSNAFSASIKRSALPAGPCVLRAVPTGSGKLPEPDPFHGPRIAGSEYKPSTNTQTSLLDDYYARANTLAGALETYSVGSCGLLSQLFDPLTFAGSSYIFYCNAALFERNGANTASELQIDGTNAYAPYSAYRVENVVNGERVKGGGKAQASPGAPQLAVSQSFDEKTGLQTIHETDPIVRCAPQQAVYPATLSSCPEFVSTGVELERTWQASSEGHVDVMTDTWRSTDGADHTVNARYFQEFRNLKTGGGGYEFPGASTFVPVLKGQQQALPAGPASILYKVLATTPEAGDRENPQGAIVYDRSPSEPLSFYKGTNESEANWFEMPYQSTVAPGGTYTLRMAFVQAYGLPEVRSLAEAAQASFYPSLSIASPASGSTTASPSVTVTGTATDGVGVSSLTVNGQAVAVGANGAWSTSVPLSVGANTITATATNQAGLAKSSAITVTYSPVPPPAPHASQVGNTSGANGKVTLTLACTGPAGSSCHVQISLTTLEKLRGHKLISVVAKTKSRKTTVGSLGVTIAAGTRVKLTITLNAKGRKLLKRFGKLPTHLTVTLTGTKPSTVVAQNLTIKPARKKRKH
jgi:hypothetical protein